MNRETWLHEAARHLGQLLEGVGETVPDLRLSVGFPGGRSNRKITVGQCWPTELAEDGVCQIFISPVRGSESTRDILGTLLHEMIHAVDNCKSGHRGNFARIARAVGFIPKLTSSDNRTDELNETLQDIADAIGPIPHATLSQGGGRAADEPKKQATRMLKVNCTDCGYTLRTTQKWIDMGLPTCFCGGEMEVA